MNKNILITGCAGFIGSALSKKLIDKNYNVYGIDNLSSGKKNNIPKKLKFVRGDCGNEKNLKKLEKINFFSIIHLAGQVGNEISFLYPLKDCHNNIFSTVKLLDLAQKTNCKHFIFSSSMSVYGQVKKEAVSENFNCKPASFYGVSKLASENYISIFKKKRINSTILRLFTVYGPGQNLENKMQGMISIYLEQIYKNKKLIVRGSGERIRDFIYIDDLTEIISKMIGKKIFFNQIYNIGSGNSYKIKDVIKKIQKITKINFPVKYIKATPLDQFYIYPNINKLKKFFNLKSFNTLDQGLKKFVLSLKKIYK